MKDSIYTIPLSEVLEPKDGCPICRLRNILEDRCLEYIMGAAMMEPDIRIETNREGFCFPHFERMLKAKNRLSLALMLESRLAYVAENELSIPSAKGGLFKKNIPAVSKKQSCFVCGEVNRVMDQYVADINAYVGKGRKCSRTVRTAIGNLSGTLPTADGNGSRCDGEESCAFYR